MGLVNFIFNAMCLFGNFFMEHTFLCVALLFGLLFTIIIKQSGISPTRKLSDEERQRMWADAKKRKEDTQYEAKFTCVNCGAPLSAEYAVCEYCGMRSRQRNGRIAD